MKRIAKSSSTEFGLVDGAGTIGSPLNPIPRYLVINKGVGPFYSVEKRREQEHQFILEASKGKQRNNKTQRGGEECHHVEV